MTATNPIGRPQTVATRGRGAKSIQLYLPQHTLDDIAAVLDEGEARTEFMRTAIDAEVAKRMRRIGAAARSLAG